jgi:predicted metal-dependent enzyme (double-stranded beta helix superfamily)
MEPDRYDWTSLVSEKAVAEAIAHAKQPVAGEPYSRTILHREPGSELLLAAWAEGARCAPHDHGHALGVVHLLRGRFLERTWTRRGRDLVVTSSRSLDAPAQLEVDDGSIHDMEASAGGISLHVYRPCIRHMRVYDVIRRETLIVSDDCGAWIPLETRQIISREVWT